MKLIDDLIEGLTDKSSTLTDILIKTKVLAFKLKNQELTSWIDSELNGYPSGQLPHYRILPCQVIGNLSNGYQRATNYPIPLTVLNKEEREGMTKVRLYQSISTLDDFVHKGDNTKMVMNVPPEMYGYLSRDLDNDFVIEFARREIGKIQIIQVLTSVRTKLLDFLLKLNEENGESNDLNSLTQGTGKDKVSSIFSSSVFGNNTTIIVGDNNTQTLTNSNNSTGNFEELKKLLLETGMKEKDVQELEVIIDSDNPNPTNREFGTKVKSWVGNMLRKAMDNSWKIGLGAAGKLLADAITRYYGWK